MRTGGKEGKAAFSVLVAFAMISLLAACQSGPPKVSIEAVRAEMSPAIIGEAMVTMTIRNQGGSDVLTGVKTDIPGAKAVLHVMEGERMVMADSVKIPAGGSAEFKMGGSHIMIEGMPRTMKAGSPFNLTLVFMKSGEKQLPLTLQPAPAMPMDHQM